MSGGGVLTVLGGAAGFALGGPMGAAVGAGIGGAVEGSANAANAAEAQGNIAKAQLAEQRATRALAMQAAEPSPEEINQLNQAIRLNTQDIARKEKLLASSDPALIEAGTQALKLLRGEEAATLSPLRNQIARQEKQLREKLRAQLGPGYENSTAGIQALSEFRRAADDSMATAQNQSLGQLLGIAQNTSATTGNIQSNISNAGTFSNIFGNQSARRVGAINATPITAAGSQFVGQLEQARGNQQTIGNIMQVGTLATMLGNQYGGGADAYVNAGGAGGGNYNYNSNSNRTFMNTGI